VLADPLHDYPLDGEARIFASNRAEQRTTVGYFLQGAQLKARRVTERVTIRDLVEYFLFNQ